MHKKLKICLLLLFAETAIATERVDYYNKIFQNWMHSLGTKERSLVETLEIYRRSVITRLSLLLGSGFETPESYEEARARMQRLMDTFESDGLFKKLDALRTFHAAHWMLFAGPIHRLHPFLRLYLQKKESFFENPHNLELYEELLDMQDVIQNRTAQTILAIRHAQRDNTQLRVRPRWIRTERDCVFRALGTSRKNFIEDVEKIVNNPEHRLHRRFKRLFGQLTGGYEAWHTEILAGLWAGAFEINLIGEMNQQAIVLFTLEDNVFVQQAAGITFDVEPVLPEIWIALVNQTPTENHYIGLQNPVQMANALLDELQSLEEQPFAEDHRTRITTEVNNLLANGGINAVNRRLIEARLYALLRKKVESSDLPKEPRKPKDDEDDYEDKVRFHVLAKKTSSASSNGASSSSLNPTRPTSTPGRSNPRTRLFSDKRTTFDGSVHRQKVF